MEIAVVDQIRSLFSLPPNTLRENIVGLAMAFEEMLHEEFASGTYTPTWKDQAGGTITGGTIAGYWWRFSNQLRVRIEATISGSMTYPNPASRWEFSYPAVVGRGVKVPVARMIAGGMTYDASATRYYPAAVDAQTSIIVPRAWRMDDASWSSAGIHDARIMYDTAGAQVAPANGDIITLDTIIPVSKIIGG